MMNTDPKGRIFLKLSVLLTLTLLLAACPSGKNTKQDKPRVVPVLVASALNKDVPVQLSAIGTVEAYSTVSVRSQIGGLLSKIHFQEGQDVAKDALLFTIDQRPYEAALKQAEANLARDIAQLENARDELKRYAELAGDEYVTRQQLERAGTNFSSFEATVNADRAVVENARLQLNYCSIYAPTPGRTGSLLVNQGNLIKANDDKYMVIIHQVQPIYVSFSVPEQAIPEIKQHMSGGKLIVEAAIPQAADRPAQGTLTFIDNSVDRATGTIRLKGTFENKNRMFWPGQFVNVGLKLSVQHNAVVVPSQAVQTGQQGQYVFVVKPDLTVDMRPVTTGRSRDGETVIEKGLSADEKVVTDGQMRLAPGARVDIKSSSEAPKVTK